MSQSDYDQSLSKLNRDQNGSRPPAPDPLALADVTVAAVDQIGNHAAGEIDLAADAIRKGADEVAHLLEDLSAAIREHSMKASAQVAEFIKYTNQTLETIRSLNTNPTTDNTEKH